MTLLSAGLNHTNFDSQPQHGFRLILRMAHMLFRRRFMTVLGVLLSVLGLVGSVTALPSRSALASQPQTRAGSSPSSVPLVTPLNTFAAGAGNQAYVGVTPFRIADTRAKSGCGNVSPGGSLGPGANVILTVVGATACAGTSGSVPSNATAVVLNVTVTRTTAPGFLTIWPAGSTMPTSSNVNWGTGNTVPNLTTVQLGSSPAGALGVHNGSMGATALVADVEGYYVPASSSSGQGHYYPLQNPTRICDTRASQPKNPCTAKTLGAAATLDVPVAGQGGIPVVGVEAVVANITVTNTTASSYATVWPTGSSVPTTSNLNWVATQTVANRVIVALGTNGDISIFNFAGDTDVVVDLSGYYLNSSGSATQGSLFMPIPPARICDTRPASISGAPDQCTSKTLGSGLANAKSATLQVQAAGEGGVPASTSNTPPTVVLLDVAVTDTTADSYLTVYPGGSRPTASDLNWTAGETRANLVIATLAPGGSVEVYNYNGSADVVIDVLGYFTAAADTWTEAVASGAGNPSPRCDAAMAYDQATGNIVMFGGAPVCNVAPTSDTTWLWNGSDWSAAFSSSSPAPSATLSMAYDAANQTVVLLAGYSGTNGEFLQTWTWNGTAWTEQFPTASPSSNDACCLAVDEMTYDAASNVVLLLTPAGNTWTWDGTNWTKVASSGPPNSGSLAYDAQTSQVIYFGGLISSNSNTGTTTDSNETWAWSGTAWAKLSPTTSPSPRIQPTMAYDPLNQSIVVFGGIGPCSGFGQCPSLDDTWAWNGSTWIAESPVSSPPPSVAGNGMAFDGSMIMGLDGSGNTWHYPTQ
ncbi:MAG: hypothetical protein M1483_06575 [Actinobacteria bacterium]|nr:hypothetical protein [Actinomycetota bacterium]MCL6105271.1 hypothetical protein [Actinomycetota bacterium]